MAKTICMPTSGTLQGEISGAVGGSASAMTSLMNNYVLVILGVPIAIIIAVLFMLLIRFIAGIFIYILIFLTIGALVGLGVYFLMGPVNSAGNTGSIILAVIFFVMAFLILLLVICFRHRISLATSIIKVASKFTTDNCLIVLLPVLLFVVMVVVLVLWVFQALGFYSLGTPTTAEHQYPFQHFKITSGIQVLFGFHVFYMVWALMFLIDTSTFIIGGAATNWYYIHDAPYSEAAERYRKKHMGSVALGSFMLALLGLIRLVFDAVVPKTDGAGGPSILRRVSECVCCCCIKLFEWFATGAYTVINIRGTNFCSSGSESFKLRVTLENIGTTSVVSLVQAVDVDLCRSLRWW